MRSLLVGLGIMLIAGCATTGHGLADMSWGYKANVRGWGWTVNLFPNDRLCRDAIQADMADWNAGGAILEQPTPCQRRVVVPVASPNRKSYWAFMMVGGGSNWQAIAFPDQSLCARAREAWKQPPALTKTQCTPIGLE